MIERSLTIGIPTFNRIKAVTSCMRRFQALNDGNGGAHISTTFQNKALPFGGFPASRQYR